MLHDEKAPALIKKEKHMEILDALDELTSVIHTLDNMVGRICGHDNPEDKKLLETYCCLADFMETTPDRIRSECQNIRKLTEALNAALF